MSNPTRRAALAALFALGLNLTLPGRARAQVEPAASPPAAVAWSSLSAEEQKLLNRFSERWETLPPEHQQRLVRGTRRWMNMTPEQRERARARHEHW